VKNWRIWLSPPDVGSLEREYLLQAFDSNWIAPVGPDLAAFEADVAARVDVPHAAAVSSGTAALHLTLLALGIGEGHTVLVQSFTFAATAFAVKHAGAQPVFVDSEEATWNVDPGLVEKAIIDLAAQHRKPRALIAVDLYGRCADYDRLAAICEHHGVLLIEDAAEALGATTVSQGRERAAGSFGVAAVLSFNGNKVITTGGGGMVVSNSEQLVERVRHLSTQARQPVGHYEHHEIGFNYRMSNLLAALGRAQLAGLDAKVARRREINTLYRQHLGDLPGVAFDPPTTGRNCWLTCITIDPAKSGGVTRQQVQQHLASQGIESRPLWMPMHRQPVFVNTPAYNNQVSNRLFGHGLCLPSGSALSDAEVGTIVKHMRECWPSS